MNFFLSSTSVIFSVKKVSFPAKTAKGIHAYCRDSLNSVIRFCSQIADKKLTAMVCPLLFREAKALAVLPG